MRISIAVFVIFFVIGFTSCKNEESNPTKNFKTYTSDDLGFSIDYPKTFEAKENFNQYVPISFFEKITDSINDRYPENVLFNVEPLPANIEVSFKDFVQAAKTKLKLEIPEIEITNEDSISINNIPTSVYTFYRPKEGGADFKSRMYIVLQKDKAINISCTAVATQFEMYLPTFDSIVNSIKFIEKK